MFSLMTTTNNTPEMKTFSELAEACASEAEYKELCALAGLNADEQRRIHGPYIKTIDSSPYFWKFLAQMTIRA